MTTVDAHASRRSWFTVQGWLYIVLATTGAVILFGSIAGAILLQRTNSQSDLLIHTVAPARTAAFQLQSALIDQQTAVRGYAITADPRSLEPYNDGRQIEQQSIDELETLLTDYPDALDDVAEVERTAEVWRVGSAEPMINAVTSGRAQLTEERETATSQTQFDAVRASFERLNADLLDVRLGVLDDQKSLRQARDIVLAATVAVFFATALTLAILVRFAVTKPLVALVASCRRTSGGDFETTIHARGPRDIHEIGEAIEAMRSRLVASLAATLDSHRTIEQQAKYLDTQAEELRRSNVELEQFAFVASHDLQEPLRKVASFCQLLEKRYRDSLDERGVQYIDFAVDGAVRMQVLINDLLAFSRVGRQSVEREVRMDDALDRALTNLSSTIRDSRATIVRPSVPMPTVIGDPTLLTMLWQNLVGNGIKFCAPGVDPEIVINYVPGKDGSSKDEFSVADNGIGIAPEFREKVFVIFQRLHSREAYAGTGIGLAMCRKIVEHHGGRIWIDTAETGGARFTFTIAGDTTRRAVDALEGTYA